MALLDEAGFTSVVATNCDQHYERPLVLGDRPRLASVIDSVSPEKKTGARGRPLHHHPSRVQPTRTASWSATMRFRILKFRPRHAAAGRPPASARRPRPRRPRPALTQDNAFFFEGAKRAQAADPALHPLRHAPPPAAAGLRGRAGRSSGTRVEASGRGTIYSYVVNHYPQVPAFDYPLVVALVELEEGTRLVANVAGIDPETMRHRHAGRGRRSRTSTTS